MPRSRKQIPWSKLKSRVKTLILPQLRARIDYFHVTSYRRSHDEAEKAWITIDGKRVATYSWYQSQWRMAEQVRVDEFFDRTSEAYTKRAATIAREDVWLPREIGNVFREYPELGIRAALESPTPPRQGIGNCGPPNWQKKIDAITLAAGENILVREFLKLRQGIDDAK